MIKKIKYILPLIIFLLFPVLAKANSISNIDMDIYIDKEGTAHVTEVWDAYLNEGTEGYKPYYNIGASRFTNFKVSENGTTYDSQSFWNPSDSFSEKAYKNGVRQIENGVELCWGISEYGNHSYTLTYDISNFVAKLNDADMVYWTLIPYELSSKPSNVHIKIYADEKFKDTLEVWGYGNYGGTAYVYDGYIEMNSEGTLQSNEYMTILVKFDKDTFNTSNIISEDFDYYHKMADKDSKKYNNKSILNFLINFIFFLPNLIFILPIIFIIKFSYDKANMVGTKKFNFGKNGKVLPKDIPNYRDIPFNKDINKTYWIATAYKLNSKSTDFLGAIILKWLMEKKISLRKVETGKIIKKEESTIDLTPSFESDNEIEKELHKMMYEASHDGLLESKEFEKWCNKNYSKILKWFDKVLDAETDALIEEGKIIITEKQSLGFISKKTYNVNETLKNDAVKLKGLKNFLEEFSRIDEKEAIEVNMWEYYLIYAQILGIADKVAKQFKKLYPELIQNYDYDYDDFIFINTICYSGMHAASVGQQRAQSYSSGGGGFSAGGGGGGSFGGGGGGGGFR